MTFEVVEAEDEIDVLICDDSDGCWDVCISDLPSVQTERDRERQRERTIERQFKVEEERTERT